MILIMRTVLEMKITVNYRQLTECIKPLSPKYRNCVRVVKRSHIAE